jgi:hypothetical protein
VASAATKAGEVAQTGGKAVIDAAEKLAHAAVPAGDGLVRAAPEADGEQASRGGSSSSTARSKRRRTAKLAPRARSAAAEASASDAPAKPRPRRTRSATPPDSDA